MTKGIAFLIIFVVMSVIIIPTVAIQILNPGEKGGSWHMRAHSGENFSIHVYMEDLDQIVEMQLEDYVKGVVAAEMPAEFEPEALKAQAVAARTYAVKNMLIFGGKGVENHPGADVSTNHKESQAWLSETQLREKWGVFNYDRYWRKISAAVDSTRGMIIVYNGEPINAVFHSTSGERTASAKEVWGFDYPYLQSVPCTWDQKSPRYADMKELPWTDLEQKLGPDAGVMAAAQSGMTEVAQVLGLTPSGRVDKVRIGSKTFSGQDVRDKLELRSTNFKVTQKSDKLIFQTTGYGHGVGLCQYGANGQAKEGKSYQDILTYYYIGVNIKNVYGS